MMRFVALSQYVLIFSAALFCLGTSALEAAKPNVVVILSDDQGWGDLSLHGNTNLKTPNIDSLARDGAQFERFFVCPVCSPTRAEFLTGRYHPRGGVFSTSTGGERLDLDEKTIAQRFKSAGYATGAFGKWHNGMQYPYHPNGRGFDEYYGFCSGHWGHYFSPVLEHNGKTVRGQGYVIDDFTNHAMRFIEQHKDQPFFCYLPYCTPHSPMQVPDEFFEKFEGKTLEKRHREPNQEDVPKTRAALAMCENIDWNVGRVLKKLDDLKLADDTIVIYFSDNGPNSWRWNGGMKGRKGSTDEGGVRVPFLIRWPTQIPKGTKIPEIAAAIDIFPTLADLAGIPVQSEKPLDGVSLKPLLIGEKSKEWPDRMIFSHWNGKVSVRTQQYRLDDRGGLFDMIQDPEQRKDIAAEMPDVAEHLRRQKSLWTQNVLSELSREDRPFPVGYAEFPITHLPARDGVPHGNIKRSAGAPNCSFFTNWKSTEDSITWDIEVETAGTYEAQVYYTCAKNDVGCQVELAFQESKIQSKITEAHDPPLVGAKEDRVPRQGESYVKDFRPLSLGTIDLAKGRGELKLSASELPGDSAIDVRQVVLTLKQ
jgi:arylsulfatase A-like enzyme